MLDALNKINNPHAAASTDDDDDDDDDDDIHSN